jgi:hypothetical protein
LEFLKLAYIAEFAIVFNLAFGEFKTSAIDDIVKESIKKLKDVAATLLTVSARITSPTTAATAATAASKMYGNRIYITKLGKFITSLDNMLKSAPVVSNTEILKNFYGRFYVFTTDTELLQAEKSKWHLSFVQFLKYLLRGILSTWVYSKTNTWNFKSCTLATLTWILVLLLILYGCIIIDNEPIFAVLGIATAFLALRPLTTFAAKLIRRNPYPRGRYYAFIQVILIVLILISCTLFDAHKLKMISLWWFYFGFLIAAAAHPILMFVGYHALEISIQEIAQWAGGLIIETNTTRNSELDDMKKTSEVIDSSASTTAQAV